MNSLRTRAAQLDEACAEAVDLARAAAEELAGPGQVGGHLGVDADGDRLATHRFACLDPAYAGWQWAVTVARASRVKSVTVSESLLLPGPDSLLAPDWVPWHDRVRPGDVGVGDLLPARDDDERLVPAAALEGDDGLLDWDDPAAWGPAPGGGGCTQGTGRTRGRRGPGFGSRAPAVPRAVRDRARRGRHPVVLRRATARAARWRTRRRVRA